MTPKDHEDYATDFFLPLQEDGPETEAVSFVINPKKDRNAAGAMTAILCRRLFTSSKQRPVRKKSTTYEWKQGHFQL